MRFGFLAHPTSTGQQNQIRATLLLGEMQASRAGAAPGGTAVTGPATTVSMPMFDRVRSLTGARCAGEIRALPYSARELLTATRRAEEIVLAEAGELVKGGAGIIGLGGATAIVGRRGQQTAETLGVPVTSGNSLTAYAAHHTVSEVLRRLGTPSARPVTITGFPGSIGLVLARMLLADGYRLNLVHRRAAASAGFLLDYLPASDHPRVALHRSVADCVADSRVFVGASSTGGLIDPSALAPGSVVVDVALPRDVTGPVRGRDDVLVLDGGLISIADGVEVGAGPLPAPTEQLNGCLAETIVLALEDRAESYSIGRVLDVGSVTAIGATAARHGLLPAPPASFGRPVDLRVLERFRDGGRRAGTGERFRRHVNPPLHDLYTVHGLDQVFTRASGSTLSTASGADYLDFVAGYGCLNVGHNHPEVVRRLREFLDASSPSFVQYVSMPEQTSELAERLCALAPGALSRVFFSNSGTEAVEAAIKLARAATGRTRLVHAHDGFHGKTLGSLSITHRARDDAFGPLLHDVEAVPFGDVDALGAAIDGAAAFVVEPVQGEAGVRLPPPGYLAEAQRLCRRAGVALVVDEIQTGLGRTGTMFACEREGVHPDVLCVAKSLSGGLVPIGATLATAELWDAAYGSASRSLLHTSTFGGGNLAAAAGLATLDVLTAPGFLDRARETGDHLRSSLRSACAPYGFVTDVRGVGMMNAIEFGGGFDGAGSALADELLTRLPGGLHAVADTLPDHVRTALRRAACGVQDALGDLLCLRMVGGLREHRMLTFLTANTQRVMRIQPPLVLTRAEADRFVTAVAQVCGRHLALAGPAARAADGPGADARSSHHPEEETP